MSDCSPGGFARTVREIDALLPTIRGFSSVLPRVDEVLSIRPAIEVNASHMSAIVAAKPLADSAAASAAASAQKAVEAGGVKADIDVLAHAIGDTAVAVANDVLAVQAMASVNWASAAVNTSGELVLSYNDTSNIETVQLSGNGELLLKFA